MENNFSERLRTLRKKAGLTQEELAYLIGVHETTIRRWETQNDIPRTDKIKKLASVLHVSEDELLNGEPCQSWVLQIKIDKNFQEEFIDMRKGVPCISDLNITPSGVFLSLGGNYDLWTSDKKYKNFVKSLDKARKVVIQNRRNLLWVQRYEVL